VSEVFGIEDRAFCLKGRGDNESVINRIFPLTGDFESPVEKLGAREDRAERFEDDLEIEICPHPDIDDLLDMGLEPLKLAFERIEVRAVRWPKSSHSRQRLTSGRGAPSRSLTIPRMCPCCSWPKRPAPRQRTTQKAIANLFILTPGFPFR
jgi:hypothetical protein